MGGGALIGGNSFVIELYGGGCGDGFSGAVAHGDGDLHAVTAKYGSFTGAVLGISGKGRYEETKK
jgi:hypothetical protein